MCLLDTTSSGLYFNIMLLARNSYFIVYLNERCGKMFCEYLIEKTWTELVVTQFKAISRYLPGKTEECYRTHQLT